MNANPRVVAFSALALLGALALGVACGSADSARTGFVESSADAAIADDAASASDAPGQPLPDGGFGCDGLKCNIPTCDGGATTTIEGDVYDPARNVKLYNVLAYVPNAPLAPIDDGPSCQTCVAPPSGAAIAVALTDEAGHFKLSGVPAGPNIPLVVQIGKWRRQITLPSVAACQSNVLADKSVALPKNQAEGHLPKLAVVMGGYDNLPCVLRNIGVDAAEFTTPDGPGRIHLYAGATGGHADTGTTPTAHALWGAPAGDGGAAIPSKLTDYDGVVLTCEGDEYTTESPAGRKVLKSPQARAAMRDYANAGGRVFAEHYQYAWFKHSSDAALASVATWHEPPQSTYGDLTLDVVQSFPKGQAFAKWLVNVGASPTLGKLQVSSPGYNLDAPKAGVSQPWLANGAQNYPTMTFNTPVGAASANVCGRVALVDMEVSGQLYGNVAYPSICAPHKLTPQELAFEFLFFDLSACVMPDDVAPAPPK